MNNIAIKFRLFLELDLVYNRTINKIYILSGWKLLILLLITIYNNKVIVIHSEIKVITKHEVWDEEKVKIEKFFKKWKESNNNSKKYIKKYIDQRK